MKLKTKPEGRIVTLDFSRGNDQAEFLLRRFKNHVSGMGDAVYPKGGWVRITPFFNCRERGYTVTREINGQPTKYVNFAEHRSSDSMVVYPFDWSEKDEKKRDEDYKNLSRYFNCYHFDAALKFIVEHLELDLDPVKEVK